MGQSRHYKLATKLLREVADKAKRLGFKVFRDWGLDFHIILLKNETRWSVFCSGFNTRLDLQKLMTGGGIDFGFEERCFDNIKDLFNFLNKFYKYENQG